MEVKVYVENDVIETKNVSHEVLLNMVEIQMILLKDINMINQKRPINNI